MPAKKKSFFILRSKRTSLHHEARVHLYYGSLLLAMAVTTPIVVDGGKKSIVGCQEVIILM